MNKILKNKKTIMIIMIPIFFIGLISLAYFYKDKDEYGVIENTAEQSNSADSQTQEDKNEEDIYIHITGEVLSPGVIVLPKGSRIIDAIEKGGGVTENADLSKINLVYVLTDGQKLIIPSINDERNEIENNIITNGESNITQGESNGKGKVNINTASQTELETIEGVGPSLANKIIEYRKKNGRYKTIDELKNVSGIGESKYETIKERIEI